MKHLSRLLVLLVASPVINAWSADAEVVPPSEPIAGKSQIELSKLWWQWAWSFDDASSPVADLTGEFCAAKQRGEVWFLAGTYGTARTIRKCTVPEGKTLFFPLANYMVYAAPGSPRSCMSLMSEAASHTNDPAALVLELDGKRLPVGPESRQALRECFDLGALSQPPRRIYPAAANGYYVAIRPLPRGTHTLNFGAILPSIQQAVTYTIIVQ
jgi:hypothetical protein